nr:secreted acidic protein 2-like [Quercus suber]
MDDYNGTHERGHFMELLMDGDYRNYCDDNDGGDYNIIDNNNDGDNNDDDDDESSNSDDDSDSDSDDDDDSNDDFDEEFYQLVAVTCEAVVTYFNKYINKTPCYDSEERLNDRDDRSFINANRASISRREHNSEAGSRCEQNTRSLTDPAMVVLRDSIANSIWGDNN